MARRRRRNRRITGMGLRLRRTGAGLLRGLWRGLPSVLLFVGMALIPIVAFATWSYLSHSEFFAVRKVIVVGAHHLDASTVERIVRERGGPNILRLRSDRIEEDIRATGWARSVDVSRSLPDTVRVELSEYRPVATLLASGVRLVDEGGRAFRKLRPGEPVVRPVISGIPNPDDPAQQRLLRRALSVASFYRRAGMESFDRLAEVHHDPARGFSLVTSEHRMIVHLGHDDFVERIRRLRFVVEDAITRGLDVPAEVHADLGQRRVVVRPRGAVMARAGGPETGDRESPEVRHPASAGNP